ncbi:ABC transporter ATP-binding protein [Reinekea blandensis]|uniref:Putative ABC transporter, ATP-binding protein n=1 Tax=Reinekea blandensis MED297 TaxID=314283 RepID=A4BC48_9GAMM|nr:ABC transporter ATP-binding protein [Reinekea blandensis]EAR10533.1 putative ABC transporter, ATP-binding protein [Reinekea sp. MED297] [Reinekea blandensis MED297]
MNQLISLSGIRRTYQMGGETLHALDGIDLSIQQNDYVAVIGSSGSGKSTLMNIIGCLDTPSEGHYRLADEDVSEMTGQQLAAVRNRRIGFIFQSFNLLPRVDALHNVMQPLVYQRVSYRQRKARAQELLERVGLSGRMGHQPNELSGGQRQRVAIARALVTAPSILLADEPTGNLDSSTTADILNLFDELHREGQTIIMVTHEPDIARRCHRQVRLKDGQIIEDSRSAMTTGKEEH